MTAPAIQFEHNGAAHALAPGGRHAAPRPEGFRDTPAPEHRQLIAEIEAGRPWREAVAARFAASRPWLHRVVTADNRTAFFGRVLPDGDGPVLDVGAGWGQIARPLARHRPVVALEPVAERLDFIRASAAQEGVADKVFFLEADYLEIAFSTRFSAVCAIGVLEWAGAFQDREDPRERQRRFLRKIRRELAPGGHLVLGIENRIGLKFLLGMPDDHLGVPHIACLPADLAARRWKESSGHTLRSFTYSQAELAVLLKEAGFTTVDFFGAFPDYKVPEAIVPFGADGRELNTWLRHAAIPPEHNGYDGTPATAVFQETLEAHYRTLAAEGIAHHFVPSFFVRAG